MCDCQKAEQNMCVANAECENATEKDVEDVAGMSET